MIVILKKKELPINIYVNLCLLQIEKMKKTILLIIKNIKENKNFCPKLRILYQAFYLIKMIKIKKSKFKQS